MLYFFELNEKKKYKIIENLDNLFIIFTYINIDKQH